MEQKILRDLYCFQCSLQFEKKSIYDLHLILIHNYKRTKETFVKKEPEEIDLLNDSSKIQSKHSLQYELNGNVILNHEGKKLHVCKFCNHKSSKKGYLNTHVASVHEGKKPFKCESCDYTFS